MLPQAPQPLLPAASSLCPDLLHPIPHPAAAQHPRTNNVKSANTKAKRQEFGFSFSMQSCYSHPLETEGLKFPRRDGAHLQPPEARERSGHLCLTREAPSAPGAPSGRRAIFYSLYLRFPTTLPEGAAGPRFMPHSSALLGAFAAARPSGLPRPAPPHRTPPEGERTPRPAGRAGGSPPFCPRAPSGSEQRPEGRSEGSASRTPGHATHPTHPAHPSPRPAPAPSRTAGPHALTRRRLHQGGRCRVSAVEPRHAPAPRSPLSPPTHRLLSLSRTAPAAGWGPTRGNGVALPQGRPAPLTAQRHGPVSRRETSAGTARGTPRSTALPATNAGTPPRVGRGRRLLLPPPRERGTGVAQGARDNHVPRPPVLDSKVLRNQAGLGACRAVAPGHF